MSKLHNEFADLYHQTAAFDQIGNPLAGVVAYESELSGFPDEHIETIVYATEQPPSVTHVQYHEGTMVAASVHRATLLDGIVTVEYGKVDRDADNIDRLADTTTRYEQTVEAAELRPAPDMMGQAVLIKMADEASAFYPHE